jgi:peptidoglycan/LPS O-acetylase OafA/YrhL
LRAIAVIAVVTYHAVQRLCPGGWAGVDVFFVLSGYLITTLLTFEINLNSRIDFRKFYIRRALRLTPALAVLLLAYSCLGILTRHIHQIIWPVVMSATYLMNWNRAFAWLPQGSLGHTWSLAMEEQFYILWPLILISIRNRRALIWIMIAIILVVSWRCYLALHGADPERTYNGFDTHADALLIGCALSFLRPKISPNGYFGKLVAIPIIILLAIFAFVHQRSLVTQTIGLSVAAMCSAWIIFVLIQKSAPWLSAILSSPILVYTGRISYGWYLWHFPLLQLTGAHLHNRFEVLLMVPFSYLLAMASFHFVEKPFLRLKERFEPARQADVSLSVKLVHASL